MWRRNTGSVEPLVYSCGSDSGPQCRSDPRPQEAFSRLRIGLPKIRYRISELQYLAGAVAGDQAVDHVLVDLDLPLLHERFLESVLKQRAAIPGTLALDFVADHRTLVLQTDHIRGQVLD